MDIRRRDETWDSFWGQALRIDFFEGQWDMYRKVADARAEWLEKTFQLDKSKPVLSLACGEGGVELALARRGFKVTGIDICHTYIYFARDKAAEIGLDNITFLTGDIRSMPLPENNGTVCCFDTLGLFGGEEEEKLLAKMTQSLGHGGVLLVDNPIRQAQKPSRTWRGLNDGYLLIDNRWDPSTGLAHMEPLFIEPDGTRVSLKDPYDETRGEHTGLSRYIYSQDEMVNAVKQQGLPAQAVQHQRGGYFLVIGSSSLAQSADDQNEFSTL